MSDFASQIAEMSLERVRLLALGLKRELDDRDTRQGEPIAITGMSCRFPQASGLDAFWALLERGGDAIVEVPSDRFDVDQYYDPDPDAPGKMYVRSGGFIDNVFDFDPAFFGIAPREALSMDPQQRLLLELSWEALEDAGEATARLAGRKAGVFVGHSTNDYASRSFGREIDAYSGTGSATSIAAGRISYVFGLTGPNLPVDTACSSSLVALHLACQSLRSGECELALVAAVNLMLAPEPTVYFCKMRALAPDGRCKTFDALANGYVRGEGCGAVVVKRLSDALADGDRIHALIRGSAVNQDGRSTGLTVPNRFAQEALLKEALAAGGASPQDVDYIEAHGTGTPLGDPIEVQAIAAVHEGRSRPLFVGSVKTNVGHLEAAAGIAGVIKTVLAIQKARIPSHLHFHQPNPYIPWQRLPITVPEQLTPWPPTGSKPRIAGVSSFGFSGTNAHVLIEQPPAPRPRRSGVERPLHLLCLSTKDEKALPALASRVSEAVGDDSDGKLADVCYSANSGRSDFSHRLALIARDAGEARTALIQSSRGTPSAAVRSATLKGSSTPRIVFLFTGQGSQYVQMGRELYETLPAFRRTLDECSELLQQQQPRTQLPLLSVLFPRDGSVSPIDQTAYSQPALFALEYSLARVWQSWGVEPAFCLGHSVGELAAACIAGVFSLEDGLRLTAERGHLMQELPPNGTMASVRAGSDAISAILSELGSNVSIAAVNGPTSTVISGGREAVAATLAETARRGLRGQLLTVSHAFHSSLMDPILDELEALAARIHYSPPRIGLVSDVSGQVASAEDFVTAAYWRRNAREPVLFDKAMRTLDDRGYSIYLEIGPQPVLSMLARSCVPDRGQLWGASLKREPEQWRQMLLTLGDLYLRGATINWRGFEEGYDRRRVSVPSYPFQRSRYVLEVQEPSLRPNPSAVAPPPPAEPANGPEDWLYGVVWSEGPSASEKGTDEPAIGRWLLFADRSGVAREVAAALESRGSTCLLVEPGEVRPEDPDDFRRLLAALEEKGPCVGIVHAWSLDAPAAEGLDENGLGLAARLGTASTLHLIRALAAQRGPNPPPLWLVTEGVHCLRDGDTADGLVQAPLWGLARAAAIEYPNLRCTRVDLERRRESDTWRSEAAAGLINLLSSRDGDDQVALRDGRRYVPRLHGAAFDTTASPEIDGSATYLITGGLGGLGLLLAGWLIQQGARHLALVNRREPLETPRAEVARFRDQGVEVVTLQADVAEADEVARLFEQLAGSMPPIKGIAHLAGVLEDGALLQQDWARFERVMRPKVSGAWNLHVQSLALPLDFMVFFSSIGSLLGSPSQGNYCAANTFMDALAHHRRARGRPAVSINWGPWSEAGMAVRQQPAALRTWETLGIGMLPAPEALETLGKLLTPPIPQVGVIKADWSRLLSLFPQGLEPPFLRELVKGKRRARPASGEWAAVLRRAERATKEDAAREVRAFVARLVARALARPETDAIDTEAGFFDLGMDSLMATELAARLRVSLGDAYRVPASFLFDHPTIESVTQYLLKDVIGSRSVPSAAPAPLLDDQGIAVIGYACRFPGASNEDDFWKLLCQGQDAIREVPADRWDIARYYDPDPKASGKLYVREGGFLEDIDKFDAQFFGISPREAVKMDPQQRLLLETTWRALENANQRADRLRGTDTSVFVGISGNDYIRTLGESAESAEVDAYLATGNALSIAAGRVSHVFGFQGPCLAIDTACSSSLVAVHLACESLRTGQARLGLAGGVNVILAPEITVSLCKIGALAPDGRCKAFDAAANGYVRSEGCGIVVLKRLEDARADGDRILAVILASSINHDGRSSGVTVPNGTSQVALLREVLAGSGLSADEVQYVEAHGTGTPLGDPIEMHSIAAVYAEGRRSPDPLLVGSVKTNVGHLEAAAGVAGLIKVVQSIERGGIPPHIHYRQPSPLIDWQRATVRIPNRLESWPEGRRRVAAVSSFGFSGTNAHCIVAGPTVADGKAAAQAVRPAHALALSAKSEEALIEHARNVAARMAACDDSEVPDIFFSLNAGRAPMSRRLFLVAGTAAEARAELEAVVTGLRGRPSAPTENSATSKIAFLFTGQGSQYAGMGRRLFETQPTFRRVVEEASTALEGVLDEALLSVLYPSDSRSAIDETAYGQPALFVLEYALTRLWESWGMKPSIVIGHSVGECAAACAAGIFSFEAGLKLVAERARLMQALPRDGGMLSIAADLSTARDLLRPHDGQVTVGAVNSPCNTVVSGAQEALAAVSADCGRRGIRARMLNASHAFHSPHIAAIGDELMRVARQIEYQEPQVPIVSSVTGSLVADGAMSSAEYWARHLLLPVKFSDGMRAVAAAGAQAFLEIGPHPTLTILGQETLAESGPPRTWLHSLRRDADDWREMLGALAELYLRGVDIDWRGFDGDYDRSWVAVPSYPFQRQRFWPKRSGRPLTPPPSTVVPPGPLGPDDALLGRRLRSPAFSDTIFENRFSAEHPSFLSDHKIYSMVVVPGAAHLAMIAAAAARIGIEGPVDLREVAFPEGIILAENEARLVQVILSPEQGGSHLFRIVSTRDDAEPSWIVHGTGRLASQGGNGNGRMADDAEPAAAPEPIDAVQGRCGDHITNTKMFYRLLAQHGIELGPNFQWIEEIWRRPGEGLARLRAARAGDRVDAYPLHPGWIDACFQLVMVTLTKLEPDFATYLPIGVHRFVVFGRPESSPWVHVTLRPKTDDDPSWFESDILMLNERGEAIAAIDRFRVRRAPRESLSKFAQRRITDSLHTLQWVKSEAPVSAAATPAPGSWLVLERSEERYAELARSIEGMGGTCVRVEPGLAFEKVGARHYRVDPAGVDSFRDLLKEVDNPAFPELKGVVHLWSDAGAGWRSVEDVATVLEEQLYGARSALNLVQALAAARLRGAPRLWLVTTGAQPVSDRLDDVHSTHSPLWGLGRVIALEHPRLRCARIDLDPRSAAAERAAAVLHELAVADGEEQVAYSATGRHVARLARYRVSSNASDQEIALPPSAPYRLIRSAQGTLNELSAEIASRRPPGRGEVEIHVRAAGLNFRDVLNALGLYPGNAGELGWEAAGVVAAVGADVAHLREGDEVVAMAPGSFAKLVTTDARLAVAKPGNLSFADAAGAPVVFLTAQYALHRVAGLRPGDKILVHAGAGGVGLAAIQLARRAGAEVLATAGSEEKRAYLRSLGVRHVFDSRSLQFAPAVRAATEGAGVDVVLNSLAGDYIATSLLLLAEGGRFVEIGKIGTWTPEQVANVRPDVRYSVLALDALVLEDAEGVAATLSSLMGQFASGELEPLPRTVFPVRQAKAAFRYMAQARHIGKVILDHDAASEGSAGSWSIRDDATYLITGGLGGLGLRLAQWLVDQGARHLLLVGRREPGPDAAEILGSLQMSGAQVLSVRADISREEDVRGVMARIGQDMSPLRGVFHAAGVLDDGILVNQDWERFLKVMAPKVLGAIHLHNLTQDAELDHFVMYSSSASMLGFPGQGNYAAANSFLDSFAYYRQSQGKPAQTINWGPWDEVGMTVGLKRQWSGLGISTIKTDQGLDTLGVLLREKSPQVAVLPIDWSQITRRFPAGEAPRLLSGLTREFTASLEPTAEWIELGRRLAETLPAERPDMLVQHLMGMGRAVLGLESTQPLDARAPLNELGFDSLMAVELANELGRSAGIPLSATLLFDYPTFEALAGYLLAEVLHLAPAPRERARAERRASPAKSAQELVESISSLSDDDVARMTGATRDS